MSVNPLDRQSGGQAPAGTTAIPPASSVRALIAAATNQASWESANDLFRKVRRYLTEDEDRELDDALYAKRDELQTAQA